MSKVITANELAEVVQKLLTDPVNDGARGELDESAMFSAFMTAITNVVCDYCGGECHLPASLLDDGDEDTASQWVVAIHGNGSCPQDGGIWKKYDPDGELFD